MIKENCYWHHVFEFEERSYCTLGDFYVTNCFECEKFVEEEKNIKNLTKD